MRRKSYLWREHHDAHCPTVGMLGQENALQFVERLQRETEGGGRREGWQTPGRTLLWSPPRTAVSSSQGGGWKYQTIWGENYCWWSRGEAGGDCSLEWVIPSEARLVGLGWGWRWHSYIRPTVERGDIISITLTLDSPAFGLLLIRVKSFTGGNPGDWIEFKPWLSQLRTWRHQVFKQFQIPENLKRS